MPLVVEVVVSLLVATGRVDAHQFQQPADGDPIEQARVT